MVHSVKIFSNPWDQLPRTLLKWRTDVRTDWQTVLLRNTSYYISTPLLSVIWLRPCSPAMSTPYSRSSSSKTRSGRSRASKLRTVDKVTTSRKESGPSNSSKNDRTKSRRCEESSGTTRSSNSSKPLFDINPYETSNHPGADRNAPDPKSLISSGKHNHKSQEDDVKSRAGIKLNAWAQSVLGLGPGYRAQETEDNGQNSSTKVGSRRPRSLTEKPELSSFMQEWLKKDSIGTDIQ